MAEHARLQEVLALVRTMNVEERLQLIHEVVASVEADVHETPSQVAQTDEHWGKALNRLMDEIGPIELKYPDIEDPVEWVKHLRAESRKSRFDGMDDSN